MSTMKIHMLKIAFALAAVCAAAQYTASAQDKNISKEEYIVTFAPLAMDQQAKYGIPSSIKLAQGLLESASGNSELARKSNNHFGIKCKSNWTGDKVYYDDDEAGECFRAYLTVEDSYIDHSVFLSSSSRYAELFKLDATDYKGWANGLKAAGYATAPHYAPSLIKLIEDYELYMFDRGECPDYLAGVEPIAGLLTGTSVTPGQVVIDGDKATIVAGEGGAIDIDNYTVSVNFYAGHGIYSAEGRRYVIARQGDTFGSIADALGMNERRLRRFNDRRAGALEAGDVVFIDKKTRNAR